LAAGRYQVKRFLGEGAKKRVYLARDTKLDRDVAVAVLKTEGIDETSLARITLEARSMARLGDHPGIVTVHDIGEDEGCPYIVSHSGSRRSIPSSACISLTPSAPAPSARTIPRRARAGSSDCRSRKTHLRGMRTKVSTKGQVILPAEIRRLDGIEPGQQFDIESIDRGQLSPRAKGATPERGLVDWLLSCPEKGFFVPVESESTDTL
jgi:AbrB family looped-hinge helix DNA binding protein